MIAARFEQQRPAWTSRERVSLAVLAMIVLLSRIPFLTAGYGLHWDAWGNARIAGEIAATKQYIMSRVPGAPLYEITIALLSAGGPVLLNGLSALAGAGCVVIFALLARQLGCRDWLLAGAALGFCSVFYISSVTTKDFTVTLFFALVSSFCIAGQRPLLAGIALGLAMGCRLPAGAMALPLSLWCVANSDRRTAVRELLTFGSATAVVAVVAFVPAFARYGLSFLTTYPPIYYPPVGTVITRGTVEVFGWVGCLGIITAVIATAVGAAKERAFDTPCIATVSVSAVVIYATLYAAFPDQAAYLLTAVPFAVLLLGRFTTRLWFRVACGAMILGSLVDWQNARPVGGPIFQDRAARLGMMANVRNFYSYARTIPGRNVFVVGAFYHGIGLMAPESKYGHFAYLLSKQELADFLNHGFTIYYLPAIRRFEYDVNGIDLAQYGGIDVVQFRESAKQQKL